MTILFIGATVNTNQTTLFTNLMALCGPHQESFYYVDHRHDGDMYRIFLYRMASYTEFLQPSALECRGHTFRIDADGNPLEFVSMPMEKFHNYMECPLTMNLDLSTIDMVMDKLDGSLISTVKTPNGFILKSKGSLSSEQAKAASALIRTPAYASLYQYCVAMVSAGYTVNFEFCSPDNRIVIGYMEPSLKVLNVRSKLDGSYISHASIVESLGQKFVVETHPVPEDPDAWIESVYKTDENIEGYIVKLACGKVFKVKTEKYCTLHHTKDSITIPRRLFEACINGGADDLRSMFATDALAMAQIDEMDEKVRKLYNRIHMDVHGFYNAHKDAYNDTDNPRKYFALAGQQDVTIQQEGTFGLVMALYLGKDANVEEFMIKNYKKYGIKDEAPEDIADELNP